MVTRKFTSSSVCIMYHTASHPLEERLDMRVTGKGLHSTNHVAKLKPAIEELIQK